MSAVFRIRICFLRIRIQGFFLNPDPGPVPDPDPGKEKTFRKAIQKKFGGSYQYGTYLPTCIFEFALQNGCQSSTCMIKKHITAN